MQIPQPRNPTSSASRDFRRSWRQTGNNGIAVTDSTIFTTLSRLFAVGNDKGGNNVASSRIECGRSMVEAMHSIHFSRPSDATKRFVRFYALRQANLGSSVLIHPVPARSEHILNFQFADEYQVHNLDERVIRLAKPAAVIGLQTHR